jgi:hypothetical protein
LSRRLVQGARTARSSAAAAVRAVIFVTRQARRRWATNRGYVVGVVVPSLAMIVVAALLGWLVAAA